MQRLCVFCGSSPGARTAYASAARELGGLLATRGIGLVYGGAGVGLMGEVADAALAAGGEVVGVIPRTLVEREVAHSRLSELRVVETMHERKALMHDLADAFVALPGGFGTLDELFEVLTWAQLGLHRKPIGLLNVEGYFDQLTSFFDHAARERFVNPTHCELLVRSPRPAELLERLREHAVPVVPKWVDRGTI